MSDSNWRRIYAIGLIVTALAAVSFASWLWTSTDALQSGIEQHTTRASQTYSDPRYIAKEGKCADIAASEGTKCVTEEREAAYEGQRNERDLEAQRIMAAWTRAIGIATIIGMGFGIFGLSLIFVTFRETRRTADSGIEANKIARESSEMQLRAYVNVADVKMSGFEVGNKPRFEVKLVNSGQTPARNCTVQTFFFYCEGDHDAAKIPIRRSGRRSVMDVVPGGPSFGGAQAKEPMLSDVFLGVVSGKGTFVFAGYIAYQDIFRKRRLTLFRYFVEPSLIANDGTASLAASNRQNRSS